MCRQAREKKIINNIAPVIIAVEVGICQNYFITVYNRLLSP